MSGAVRVIVVVGYSETWQWLLEMLKPPELVVFVEEPDVAARRQALEPLARFDCPWRLIEWEYQRDEAADAFAAAHADLPVAAVVPTLEYAMPFAARLAERYGVPGSGFGAARVLRDKATLRWVAGAAGIPNPASRRVRSAAEVSAFVAEHGLPALVKLSNREGGVGATKIRDESEVMTAWEAAQDRTDGWLPLPDRGVTSEILAEQFIVGRGHSVEMLLRGGEPVFWNATTAETFPGPHPVLRHHVVPSDSPGDVVARMVLQTRQVAEAVGFDTGIMHCEWMVSDGVPYLIECTGRLPGDMISVLLSHAYGFNLSAVLLDLYRGAPLELGQATSGRPDSAAAVEFLQAPPGVVESVHGTERARAVPGVVHLEVDVEPGSEVAELRSAEYRAGTVVATGESPAAARATANAAAGRIRIVTRAGHSADTAGQEDSA